MTQPRAEQDKKPSDQEDDRDAKRAELGSILGLFLVVSGAVALIPYWFGAETLSGRSQSMRLIISLAGMLLVVAVVLYMGRRMSRTLALICVGVFVASVSALPSVQWNDFGWGTVPLVAVFLIPAMVKLATRGR